MRARYFVAVLVVAVLSAALFCAPAGSATRAQVATAHGQATGDPSLKDGTTPGEGSTGDDDRWGDTTGTSGTPSVTAGRPSLRVPAPVVTGDVLGVRIEVRLIPGLALFVITLR